MLIILFVLAAILLWGIIENRRAYRKLMRGELFVHYSSQDKPRPGPPRESFDVCVTSLLPVRSRTVTERPIR